MTDTAPLREDFIDAVVRPVIGFLVGMVLGYTVQLAGVTGWPLALGYTAILGALAVGSLWMYERLRGLSDWFFEKTGIAPRPREQLVPIPKRRKHWFVRYGWIMGLAAGMLAVFVLPEEMLAWF